MTGSATAAGDTATPLWTPDPARVAASAFARFKAEAERLAGEPLADFTALHAWSIRDRAAFWDLVWDFAGVIGDKGATRLIDGDRMPGARFFPEARINFAENLLRKADDTPAILHRAEDKRAYHWSWDELSATVSRLQQAYRAMGLEKATASRQ